MREAWEVIWAAGFIDGEGCLTLYRRKDTRSPCGYPRLSASQVEREPLEVAWTAWEAA